MVQKQDDDKKEAKQEEKQVSKADRKEEKDLEKEERELDLIEETRDSDLGTIIELFLPEVMRDRKRMGELEHALDDFITSIPKEQRTPEAKKKIIEQIDNASKALESLKIRLVQSY